MFYSCKKHLTKSKLGRKRFISAYSLYLSSKDIRAGAEGCNMDWVIEAETLGKTSYWFALNHFNSLIFYTAQVQLPGMGDTNHGELCPPILITNQENILDSLVKISQIGNCMKSLHILIFLTFLKLSKCIQRSHKN